MFETTSELGGATMHAESVERDGVGRRAPLIGLGAIIGLSILVVTAACGGTTTTPVTPTPAVPSEAPPPPPPVVENSAPTIRALVSSSSRVEADEQITLTADVEDAETPLEQLIYEWTSDKGTGRFIGTGREVKWEAPHLRPTPDRYVLTLTVIEKYERNGEAKEHRTSSSITIRYNDSYREIRDMALTFLQDFSTFSVSPEACVRNFSDSCHGKQDELSEIRDNRRLYRIQSGTFSIQSISLNPEKTAGTALLPCQFVSIVNATGKTETATGTCTITAIYEPKEWKWFLCESLFSGKSTISLRTSPALVP